ncbi:MAG: betaine/proline/choline family ABC transporter ATP-binding protein [Actinobacteria bacterium]|nr:MAG: betaine/proline/choline family ABC transporter ATP-binding protein [Actinomycetota bacterium]
MIRLEHVSKRYPNGQLAVDDLSLEVPEGEICVLVGPSGCGKTTTMKMVNRLIEPTGGRIFLDGDDVTRVDPVKLRRRMGYVIQQVGLFPHLTIADNVGTVPRLLGWDRTRIRARVDELLGLVGLEPEQFRDRYPEQLSGGQSQRVGVARALGADPPLLLMDEPFGAIDPIARDRLQREFIRLQGEVRKTIIFVTHDIDEAVKLGDRIAILRQGGVLEQYDTPAEVLGNPASDFVADFVGADRGLKRLNVTGIEVAELAKPPVVALDASLDEARRAMDADAAPWAIVLDAEGDLHGYLNRARANGDGRVGDLAQRMEAWVGTDATLKDALSVMLLHDAGWVAVLEGGRFLGVLTPDSLHAAMRHSMGHEAIEHEVTGRGVEP